MVEGGEREEFNLSREERKYFYKLIACTFRHVRFKLVRSEQQNKILREGASLDKLQLSKFTIEEIKIMLDIAERYMWLDQLVDLLNELDKRKRGVA